MSDAVAKRSPASAAMVERAMIGRALMGGTRAMRDAGRRYLPKFEAESHDGYAARLAQSWLFNGYRKTVRDMTGRVFGEPVELGEDAPEQFRTWSENIDNAGNDLSVFSRQVFMDAMQAGVSYIMVDAPPRQGVTTRAQAEAQGLRPYFVHLRAEDILGWRSEVVANRARLTMLRIQETVTEPDPKDEFGEEPVKQIRVLDVVPGGVRTRLYRQLSDNAWALVQDSEVLSPVPEITIAPVYLNRTGFMEGEPPLEDLADINVAHWQSQSDQRSILHFARVPIMHATGRQQEDGPLVISAGRAVISSAENARLEWVEHSGAAIGAGRQDLKDLEFQMETFGLQLLVSQHQQSATGEVLDATKETSQLAMFADALRDALERAFGFMGLYAGLGEVSVSVTVNDDFGVTPMTAQEMTVLLSAVNTGQISRTTFLREMSRRGMLASDLDPDEEAERIASEGPSEPKGPPLELGAEND